MPYTINNFNGTVFTTLADGVVDKQFASSIYLLGKNVTGYGSYQNDNFLWLLQNFAGMAPPVNQVQGQTWFDNSSDSLKLKVYDGNEWTPLTTTLTTSTTPASSIGTLWYDTVSNQMFLGVSSGTNWALIGPEAVAGFGKTKFESGTLSDTSTYGHAAIRLFNDSQLLGVITTSSFNVAPTEDVYIAGIQTTFAGLSLAPEIGLQTNYITAGLSTSSIFTYFTTGTSGTNVLYSPTTAGITQGMKVVGFNIHPGDTYVGAVYRNSLTLVTSYYGDTPAMNIGPVYGLSTFTGSLLHSGSLMGDWTVGSVTTPLASITTLTATTVSAPTISATTITAPTISSTNISASGMTADNMTATTVITTQITAGSYNTNGQIIGNWLLGYNSHLSSTYADLAENYTADDTYSPGVVMDFGGVAETTMCVTDMSTRVAGIISTNPAFLLNDQYEIEGYVYSLALAGRVPCYVKGKINKGDMLVSGGGGYARAESNPKPGTIIARAIDSYDSNEVGMIEVQVCRG